MRTFIAIELDDVIKGRLNELIVKLKSHQCQIRWTKIQAMHLTLKFLGEIPEAQTSLIREAMTAAVQDYKPFLLRIKGTGTFPIHSKHPRIIWADIQRHDTLQSLHKTLDKKLEKLGFQREKRKFHPHLTLGRVKSSQGITSLLSDLEQHSQYDFGEMQTNSIILYKSTLKPTGAEYTKLIESRLS